MKWNERGETLTTVMVAVAIAGIMALAIMSLISNVQGGISNATFRSEVEDSTNALRASFSTGNTCIRNLEGKTIPAVGGGTLALNNIFYLTTGGALDPSAKVVGVGTSNNYTVDSVTLRNGQLLSSVAGISNTYLGSIETVYSKSNTLGPGTLIRSIPIVLQSTAAGVISSCVSAGSLGSCAANAAFPVAGFGNANLPLAPLTHLEVLNAQCQCECRITGWSCKCLAPPPPPGPTPSPTPNGGDSDGSATDGCCA